MQLIREPPKAKGRSFLRGCLKSARDATSPPLPRKSNSSEKKQSGLRSTGAICRVKVGCMTAILELPEVRQRVSRLSVEEYHRLGEFNENGRRTELIRGIVIEEISKSPRHSSLSTQLDKRILLALPDGYTARKEEPLTFVDSEPEPDISVLRGRDADFATGHPTSAELVVEISVSSAALDRELASLYAEAGVKEYWMVLVW
jgi:Uma2 family endonuclease